MLGANSVLAGKIADNAVTTAALANNSVGSSQIQSGAVGSSQIANGSVTGADIDFARVQSPEACCTLTNPQSATATCPAGKVVSGGGYQLEGTPSDWSKIVVYDSQPFTPPPVRDPVGCGGTGHQRPDPEQRRLGHHRLRDLHLEDAAKPSNLIDRRRAGKAAALPQLSS